MSGVVVWFTGLPSSGKSTAAQRLRAALATTGIASIVLDGDEIRDCLRPTPGHGSEERRAFYETLANLAAMLAEQGHAVLVPATAHRQSFRDYARQVAPDFVEVYVATPLAVCESRDDKGLYRASRAAQVSTLPGAGVEYQVPPAPDLVITADDEPAAIMTLAKKVAAQIG